MQPGRPQPGGERIGPRYDWTEIGAGVALSLLFHGLVAAALVINVFWAPDEESEEPEEVDVQDVDLLALGEEPDPDTLPRLSGDQGAPPETGETAPEPEAEPEPPPEPEPEPEAEPDPEETADEQPDEEARRREQQRRDEERRRRMDEAMGRFEQDGRGDEAPEGSPDGVAGGTATDEGAADMRQTYRAKVLRKIEEHWEIPAFISESEVQELAGEVRVSVRVSESGHITRYEFVEQSGHEHFDDYVERALRQFKADEGGDRLPLPGDEQLRQVVLDRGLVLSNWERLERQ